MAEAGRQLVVFADDWGRHPSSAQHLVRHLLPEYAGGTLWVNTVGTRRPRLTVGDVKRALGKLRAKPRAAAELPAGLRVIAPRMYPGFRAPWQRGLNARLLTRAVGAALASEPPLPSGERVGVRGDDHGRPSRESKLGQAAPHPNPPPLPEGERGPRRVAVTTLPITADLVGRVDVDRWVYYCVDDFSVWPGLDGGVMDAMERELVAKVDAVVAVSETLVERMRSMGREDVTLLTHGVDLDLFDIRREPTAVSESSSCSGAEAGNDDGPTFAFWGLIDERMDSAWVKQLVESRSRWEHPAIFLAGPKQQPPPVLFEDPWAVAWCGELPFDQLRYFAATHSVLIMPYIDAPVTRAMQPLKLKEYLATYKPVVVRDLPATRAWADCCDVVSTAEEFVRVCAERARTGLPEAQRAARERRLPGESWAAKAAEFAAVLRAG